MRYAIAYEHGLVFQHFGKTPCFLLVDMEAGKIMEKRLQPTDGYAHTALITLLSEQQVDTLVCGGIGSCGREALETAGITLISGIQGNVEDVLVRLQAGTLQDQGGFSNCCGGHGHHHDEK